MFDNDFGEYIEKIKNDAGLFQEQLKNRIIETNYNNQITIKANGLNEVIDTKIDSSLLCEEKKEELEKALCAAFNDAITKSRESIKEKIGDLTNGMDLSNISDLFKGVEE